MDGLMKGSGEHHQSIQPKQTRSLSNKSDGDKMSPKVSHLGQKCQNTTVEKSNYHQIGDFLIHSFAFAQKHQIKEFGHTLPTKC